MVLGYFGKTPVKPDPDVVKISAEQLNLKPTTEKAVDINDKDPKKGRRRGQSPCSRPRIFPRPRRTLSSPPPARRRASSTSPERQSQRRAPEEPGEDADPAAPAAPAKAPVNDYTVQVNNNTYAVQLRDSQALVNGVAYALNIQEGISAPVAPVHAAPVAAAAPGKGVPVKAPMPGLILRANVKVETGQGERSAHGPGGHEMENEIFATVSGTVTE
jgi:pyruvate carboxylase subunit B